MAEGADLTEILANGKGKVVPEFSTVCPAFFVESIGTCCVMFDLLGWYSLIARVAVKPKIVVPITATRNLPFKHALIFSSNVFL